MLRSFFFCLLVLIGTTISKAATVKGTVFGDDQEPLIGATVQIKAAGIYTTVGLDGSFTLKRVPLGAHRLEIRFVGYEPREQKLTVKEQNEVLKLELVLNTATELLSEVEITEGYNLATEAGARGTEKNSPIVVNTISAKTIESSPDVTVANVVQRVSGLTVERNNNGNGSGTTAMYEYEVTGDDTDSREGFAYFEDDDGFISVMMTSFTGGLNSVSLTFNDPVEERTFTEITGAIVNDDLGTDEVAVTYSNGNNMFLGTSGSVEITEVSATHIHGNFDVEVKYEPFDGADTLTANIKGSFIAEED